MIINQLFQNQQAYINSLPNVNFPMTLNIYHSVKSFEQAFQNTKAPTEIYYNKALILVSLSMLYGNLN